MSCYLFDAGPNLYMWSCWSWSILCHGLTHNVTIPDLFDRLLAFAPRNSRWERMCEALGVHHHQFDWPELCTFVGGGGTVTCQDGSLTSGSWNMYHKRFNIWLMYFIIVFWSTFDQNLLFGFFWSWCVDWCSHRGILCRDKIWYPLMIFAVHDFPFPIFSMMYYSDVISTCSILFPYIPLEFPLVFPLFSPDLPWYSPDLPMNLQ